MLFEEQIARKPNLYPWTQEFIDAMWSGFWTPNEFSFKGDVLQFRTQLTGQEQQVVTRALSAIGQVEIAVKRFWAKLGDHFRHPSMYDLGFCMANTEVIHNQAYEKLLDKLGLGQVFEDNLREPVVKGRVEYLRKHLEKRFDDDRKQYVYSIILFTLFVENVSLFSQFYIILWFNRSMNQILKDTAQQVQYTRNEEMLHAQVGIRLINTLRAEYPELFDAEMEQFILDEARAAFRAESDIVDWMVGDYAGDAMSAETLKAFIQNRMNESLVAIGMPAVFSPDADVVATTYWMDEALLGGSKTDFFFKKPIDYAKSDKVYSAEEMFA